MAAQSRQIKSLQLTWLMAIIWCLITITISARSAMATANSNPSSHVTPATKTNQTVHYFRWSVEYMYWSPDCEERMVMGINGQFPGPTIRARAGDIVHVDLTNKLPTEGVVIHWHGIRQLGTPWADGTASISQCAINPGETFKYRFEVDKPGTYFYHGHYGMQRSAGLYGSLIVDVADDKMEPFKYDDEFDLLLSDWWHTGSHEQALGLTSKPFKWIGEAQSLLVNGRGQYNCSLAPSFANSSLPVCKFNGSEQCSPPVMNVLPNKTYRIRIASSTSLASLNLAIGSHKMTVVEADGNYVQPFTVDDLDIYSGQTYSVLITTDQDPTKNYWLRLGVIARKPNTAPGLTILNYQKTTIQALTNLPTTTPPAIPLWNNFSKSEDFAKKIFALKGTPQPPKTSTRRIILLNTQNRFDGYVKWSVNNVSLSLPSTPYLGAMKFKLHKAFRQNRPAENFPSNYDITIPPPNPNTTVSNGVYRFSIGTVVDVILQNANSLTANNSETHPWHLHGHDFWVLGYGKGKFKDGDEKKFNLVNPPLRNTDVIFPYGWTALRYVADNPGVWAFHCHIEPHLEMGMGLVFAEGVDKVKGIPANALACGQTAQMFLKNKYLH